MSLQFISSKRDEVSTVSMFEVFLSFSCFNPFISHSCLSRPPSVPTALSLSLSLSLLTLPFLVFLHSFFPWLFWVPLPSLSLLLLKPRDAAHLTAAAVYRARLSPRVAATTAVNLVQTRCLFYSLALSRGRKKKEGGRLNKKAKGLLGLPMGVFLSSPLLAPHSGFMGVVLFGEECFLLYS